ncbi:MAG: class I SAM-dependent methyltransferase [Parvibaculaceae bacterium]
MTPSESGKRVDLYGASYRNFAHDLYAEIRRAAFGEDIGQTSWLTAEEQDLFISWLDLTRSSRLLDVACGSGKPTLRIAQKTQCHVSGVDIHADGIASATANAREIGYEGRAHFHHANAAEPLSFESAVFDALTCIDAINHLPDRPRVLADWHRVLKPGGSLLFTDPIVLTGPITNEEIAIRASIGLFVFAPQGLDETLLQRAGFDVERVEDRTANMAANAEGWRAARENRESELRKIEGDDAFFGQQRFLDVAARLAREKRLSRFAILARKRGKDT